MSKTLHLQISLADNGYIVTTNGKPTSDDPLAQRKSETLIAAEPKDVMDLIEARIPVQPGDEMSVFQRAFRDRGPEHRPPER